MTTEYVGVNPSLQELSFYQKNIRNDRDRVRSLFAVWAPSRMIVFGKTGRGVGQGLGMKQDSMCCNWGHMIRE
jgi:hypothetical protein